MIEMRTKHGYSDFNKNFAVIKKFMKYNNLKEKKLIYEELKELYQPRTKI